MFKYNKFLEFPVNIKNKNTRLANIVATQYGGAYGKSLSIAAIKNAQNDFKVVA